jgi:hypothetical protein
MSDHNIMLNQVPEKDKSVISLWISIISALIAVVSAVVAYLAYVQPGIIRPIGPSGYAIVRGDGDSPSDCLVIPMEWQNTSGKPVLIRHPELSLIQVDNAGNQTGAQYRFLLAGEYPEISYAAFASTYAYENSFVISANAVPIKILAFHNESWWDKNSPLYTLQFKSGQNYKVVIRYQVNAGAEREQVLFTMPTFTRVDVLSLDHSKSYWDFWYLADKNK